MGKMQNVGLELSLNKNEQRRDTHLGISRRHEVHDVPVWLRCRRRRKRLRTTRRSRGGAARGGGTPSSTSKAPGSSGKSRTLFCTAQSGTKSNGNKQTTHTTKSSTPRVKTQRRGYCRVDKRAKFPREIQRLYSRAQACLSRGAKRHHSDEAEDVSAGSIRRARRPAARHQKYGALPTI